MTKLIQAIENDDYELALRLIEANEDNIINIPDGDLNSPLHLTTNLSLYPRLSPTITQMLHNIAVALLNKGANPNVKDKFGSSPIHYVTIRGNLELLSKLVECGADWNCADAANETPIHQAIRRKHDLVIEYFLSIPDLLFKNTLEGQSPMDYARRFQPSKMPNIQEKFKIQSKNKTLMYNQTKENDNTLDEISLNPDIKKTSIHKLH